MVGLAAAAAIRNTDRTGIGVVTFLGVALSAGAIAVGLWLLRPSPLHLAALDAAVLALAGTVLLLVKRDLIFTKNHKEWSRQSALHLALLTGVVIFSIPFLWLLATSLKEDKDAASLTFIPRQQLTIDGRPVFEMRRPARFPGGEPGEWVRVVGYGEASEERDDLFVAGRFQGAPKMLFTVSRSKLRPVRVFSPKWSNYAEALRFLPPEYKKGLVPLWNTVYISILSIVGTLLSSSLVAYSFARLRWPGRDTLFVMLLATMMLPGAVTMIPVYLVFRALDWIDTLRPLWIGSFFAGAFNVFLLRQFFMTIPRDLEDAAKIDGCSFFGIYWRVMLPLVKPALAALTIMSFMAAWNNFMGPLIYISSPEKMPLAYALQLFQGAHGGERPLMMAASTLVMLPVLIVFFFTQRYFIQGITLTGMKS